MQTIFIILGSYELLYAVFNESGLALILAIGFFCNAHLASKIKDL